MPATDGAADTVATTPLWRGAQVFRLVTMLYAIGHQVVSARYYRHPELSWTLTGVLVGWSVLSAFLLARWKTPRWFDQRMHTAVVWCDLLVVLGLIASTRLVADYGWYHDRETFATTLWSANPVISAAVLWGATGGTAAALAVSVLSLIIRGQWNSELWSDPITPVMVSVGLAMGLASVTARRAQQRLEQAVRMTAAATERERLAREVHDGVLQTLAYISRTGTEIGGRTAELAARAAEQELALRILISEQGQQPDGGGAEVDLRPLLTAQAAPAVQVATPGEPVRLPRRTAAELAATVAAALANTAQHAGPAAKAYVLLEDTGDEVIVSVRDDGPGIPAGRLAAAAAEGRMGVSRSIIGRITELGGTADLLTVDGTEWEFRMPRSNGRQ
ncbi:MacS family sensor histidine kinase [Nocardia stercoris]|nr:DUF5931 domain-containing protein [Nocardia stercoris]